MNTDEFDRFTRAVGSGISRREIIKLLIASIISTFLPIPNAAKAHSLFQESMESVCVPPGPDFPPNPQENHFPSTMTCEQVKDHLKNIGLKVFVWDKDLCTLVQKEKPGLAGATSYYFEAVSPPNFKVTYTESSSPVDIGDSKIVRAVSTPIKIIFGVRQKVYFATWSIDCTHDKTLCEREYRMKQAKVANHEQLHIRANRNIVDEVNSGTSHCYQVRSYTGSGFDRQSATKSLENSIKRHYNEVLDCMYKEAKRREEILHKEEASGGFPDCSFCASTPCTDENGKPICCPASRSICCSSDIGGGCCGGDESLCCPSQLGGICCPSDETCCGPTHRPFRDAVCCPPWAPKCCPPELGGGCCPADRECMIISGFGARCVLIGRPAAFDTLDSNEADHLPQLRTGGSSSYYKSSIFNN